MGWLESSRVERPWTYRGLVGVCTALVLFLCFILLPESAMLRAMGVTKLQNRVSAAANGLYWSSRSVLHGNGGVIAVGRVFGSVQGIDEKGKLIASLPTGDRWESKHFTLANIQIVDAYVAAQIVGSLQAENARFEIFDGDSAVVWIRNSPLNIKLIEAGAAKPDPNQPSNIFDEAFAAWYWGMARGEPLAQDKLPNTRISR